MTDVAGSPKIVIIDVTVTESGEIEVVVLLHRETNSLLDWLAGWW